ncbi:hypothetical protein [Caulobacter sp. RHG1]|uniref:hypothetical protein n=1 Tax=Caulobacter sp. (strain RHG1) TaxID=2545762 RepID=UPI0015567B31|nr:hypothetical protein [Caulobacter sp. RHG1]
MGHGQALLSWFESSGFADRYAPIYIALRALVRGEKTLLDANLEVRHAASQIYERLVAGQPPGRASGARAAETRARHSR